MQGAYREHIKILKDLHVDTVEIRNRDNLVDIDGLIIPGGESTTIGKFFKSLDIHEYFINIIDKTL